MMILLILLILLFFVLFFLPLDIEIEYKRRADDDSFKLAVYPFFRFLGIGIKIPLIDSSILKLVTKFWVKIDSFILNLWPGRKRIDIAKEISWKKVKLQQLKKLLHSSLDFKLNQIIFNTLKIKCRRLCWKIKFGWADPALTGISNGFIWAIIGIILRSVERKIDFVEEPLISVQPDFKREIFWISFQGIFSVLIGNIIFTVIRAMVYKIKGGSKQWENIQLKS